MSHKNVELARLSMHAINPRDLDAYLALVGDDSTSAKLLRRELGSRNIDPLRPSNPGKPPSRCPFFLVVPSG